MREQQLNRLLKLVKATGDKLVVLDSATDHAAVLMPLDDYEGLVGQGKVNPEVLPPEPGIGVEEPAEADPESNEAFELELAKSSDDEREAHGNVANPTPKKLEFSDNWAAENSAPLSEEDLSDVPEEEEKFYLEPV